MKHYLNIFDYCVEKIFITYSFRMSSFVTDFPLIIALI